MALCKSATMAVVGGGTVNVPYTPANLTRAGFNRSTAGSAALAAAASGKTNKLYKLVVWVAGAVNVKLTDGGVDIAGMTWSLDAGGFIALDLDKYAHYESGVNSALAVVTDAAIAVGGYALYLQD